MGENEAMIIELPVFSGASIYQGKYNLSQEEIQSNVGRGMSVPFIIYDDFMWDGIADIKAIPKNKKYQVKNIKI